MKREDSVLFVVIGSVGTVAILVPILLSLPVAPKILVRPDVPDSVFIDQTEDLPEVKAYLERYSNATVKVFRQPPQPSIGGPSPASIVVSYSITRSAATGEIWNTESGPIEPYANLGVWFNPEDLTLWGIRFVCWTKLSGTGQFMLRSGITEYLQTANGYCWDDPNPPIIRCSLENLQRGIC
ncbi:MAG: hypothetical protein ACREBU_07140 [Nitrososphaera sp.]